MSLEVVLPVFILLVASLSFHEAAHAWAASRLGDPTARLLGRLTLNPLAHIDWVGTVLFPLVAMISGLPLIGWAKPVPVDPRYLRAPRRDFALVALAGPVSNIVLAIGAAVLLQLQGGLVPDSGVTPLTQVLYMAVFINVLLAAFNMLPVPPLDGGNVLAGVVPEPVAQLIDRVRPFGIFILYGLVLTGGLTAIVEPIRRFLGNVLL
ncbi:MAG: site-2 protease family protein [Acidimicrobiia bacterium]